MSIAELRKLAQSSNTVTAMLRVARSFTVAIACRVTSPSPGGMFIKLLSKLTCMLRIGGGHQHEHDKNNASPDETILMT